MKILDCNEYHVPIMYIFGVYFFSCKSVNCVTKVLQQFRTICAQNLLSLGSSFFYAVSKVAVMNVEFQQLYTGITSFSKDIT